ncbi:MULTISPECIES: Cdc6/Cdc18 family protein [Acidiplasma]|uniref:Uncharacterized protein n=2 Tax=Acidiplasma TaxID=507753 RepID=A0A0N8VKH1_9ARCH|nr:MULTISPECIES: Cdc6/Cdc18 family protein [Acidiplasma]KJE48998.1 hypothetical protein TZ01_07000 [Acidiplasma sp. MBA-1]KPV46140.1 hypothetical protein SE19_06870 [Acidiplasma aeolicum]KQB33708.1 hypothetical protein AOG55_02230 [Acidiplasma cupricumulans]KQB34318.1 hypothetical protein AOG54_05235 [Acidiplasma aeolicum]WMT54428.1 MAG: orc1/cdc6 family replication initiation protein [Acidiplasma sp.]
MIVINPDPLDLSYVPDRMFFRDDHIKAITSALIQPSKSKISTNMVIYGPSGTGKTSTIKFIMKSTPSLIYENAASYQNVRQLLEHVLLRLGRPTAYKGMSYNDIFYLMKSSSYASNGIILAIDEASGLIRNDRDGIYNLLRSKEIYNINLSIIIISMENPVLYLERRYGTVIELPFNKYTKPEILDIIRDRSVKSLVPGSCSIEILDFISEISSKFGSARYAIELLQKAAYMAEYRSSTIISADDVRFAVSIINPYITESRLSMLGKKDLIVLLSICNLLEKSQFTNIERIKKETAVNSEIYNIKIGKSIIYSIIKKLEELDIISSRLVSHGNKSGVVKNITVTDAPVSMLSKKIEDLLSRI